MVPSPNSCTALAIQASDSTSTCSMHLLALKALRNAACMPTCWLSASVSLLAGSESFE